MLHIKNTAKNDLFRIMCWLVPYLHQSIHNLKIQYLDCIKYIDQKEFVNALWKVNGFDVYFLM